ncbi:hypothetical protein KC660_03385, partial [Candidatus Dojkabacteria bacterium]|nr:hypothetical protein [Candidatus Dojkabacteria bacterium]
MKNKFQSIIKISIFIIVCEMILTGIYLFRSGNSLGSDYLKVSKFNPNETLNDSNRQATKQEPVDKVTETDIVLEKENEKVEYELEQGGWIPNWAQSSGMESYSNNPERFNSISPVWYVLNANQKLEAKSGAKDSTVLSKLKSNGTKVIPTISSFDSDILSKLINNPNLVNGFTDEVLSEVKIYSYDGIDIDFESIKSNDKGKFTEFIKVLSEKLHKENKVLTIAVLSKDSDLYDSVNLTG